ncbi:MAG TPA: TrmH family RNA methyltransferase [Vicinamibacteria bacterium]|nr:TrmH family RNA methyltransferase [Vicinamibacteria bacterium]
MESREAGVDIVLVRPSRPANVAAACRAMKNMGLGSLLLVGGVDPQGMTFEERSLAYGAWDILDGARSMPRLAQAVEGSVLVVGTSGLPAPDAWTPRRLAEEVRERAAVGRTAVVFGPESSGLRSDELDLCHARVHIPADAAHTSLNLAQAVLLVAYEIRLAVRPQVAPLPGRVATAGEIEAVLEALKKGLLAIGYLNPANPEAILAELRRLLARSRPTPRETSLLRGMARQIAWAGERIGERHGLGG